jgi:hypothetical protein
VKLDGKQNEIESKKKKNTIQKDEEEKNRENLIFSRKWKGKKIEGKGKKRMRKFNFLIKCSGKEILQGGYQICSDTMLGNMISMKEWEKTKRIFLLMIKVNDTKW